MLHFHFQAIPLKRSNEETPMFSTALSRLLFDIVFLAVFTILLLTILLAILVDKFSTVREQTVRIKATCVCVEATGIMG